MHVAPLYVGVQAPLPRGFQPKNFYELIGPSFACETVQRLSAKGSESGGSAKAVDCGKGMSTLLWASAARDIGNFCEHRVIKFRKTEPRASRILLSRRRIGSRSPRVNLLRGTTRSS